MRALLLVAAILWPTTASAEDLATLLARAESQKGALEYDAALATLDQALRLGRADRRDLARIFRLQAELHGGLDDGPRSVAAFQRLLALDPDARLPAGSSPKLTVPFGQALETARPLRVSFAPAPGGVTVSVDEDTARLVRGARVRVSAEVFEAHGRDRISVTAPPSAQGGSASALDEHGNELVTVPLFTTATKPPPIYRRPIVWLGLATVFAATGAYFGLRVLDAESELAALPSMPPYEQVRAIQDRGERDALVANISFAAAGVSAIVAVVLAFTDEGPPLTWRF